MSVAALVFAILGIVTFWIPWVGVLGGLFGLVGLILGIAALRSPKGNKGLGIVGLVVGGIALIGCAVIQVPVFIFTNKGIDAVQGAMDEAAAGTTQNPPFQQKP
jgi:hypothetical protein